MKPHVAGMSLAVAFTACCACGGKSVLTIPSPLRPTYAGFEPAYPLQIPRVVAGSGSETSERLIDAVLEIDAKGQVKKGTAVTAGDTPLLDSLLIEFRWAQFEPGRIDGKRKKTKLAVTFWIQRGSALTHLRVPLRVDSLGAQRDYRLSYRTLMANQIAPPRVTRLAPYDDHRAAREPDSLYPLTVWHLRIDADGRVRSVENIFSTARGDIEPLGHLLNWGEYAPLQMRKKRVSSGLFLVLPLYAEMTYPVPEFSQGKPVSPDPLERTRVVQIFDTTGVVLPPVPRNVRDSQVVLSRDSVNYAGKVLVAVHINAAGAARLATSNLPRKIQEHCHDVLQHMKFYPAIDLQSNPKPFRGFMELTFNGTLSVTARCQWLEE